LPRSPSALPRPRGGYLSLASISICLASASGSLPRPCLDLHLPCLGLGVTASALPRSPSALPRPRGDCLVLGLASISICLASASGWLHQPCLDLHLPCPSLGVTASASALPRSPSVFPRHRRDCLGIASISICLASGWLPWPRSCLASFPSFTAWPRLGSSASAPDSASKKCLGYITVS